MLHLHRSHRLEELAETLAAVVREPTADPFQPEWVIVHGRSTEQWLRAQLAHRLGVCANVRFLSPSTLVEEVVERALGTDRATARAWRGDRLLWAVLESLRDARLKTDPTAAPLLGYLRLDDSDAARREKSDAKEDEHFGSARAVQLAQRIADLFQRYVVSRPALARAWSRGERDGDDWQPMLWRLVRERLGDASSPAELLTGLRDRLTTDTMPAGIPSRIAWLAQGAVGELPLEVSTTLASAGVDVHLLLSTPSRALLAGGVAGHPMLRSLARQSAGVESLVASVTGGDAPTHDDETPDDACPSDATMLARLQHDLVRDATLGPLGGARNEITISDRSLCVHVCHGRARQADALREELLRLFDAHHDLMPRDVLVLTPDVAGFAPLVSAAFAGYGKPHDSDTPTPPSIPLRVVDRALRVENPVMDAALRLLDLAASRVDAVATLDFLALPAVRARFDIGEDGHETLRRWTRESGVRWGMDGQHRETFHVPGDNEHTWRFGLDRMLLGWALPGETLAGASESAVLPYDEIEGQDAELLGGLAEACERTFHFITTLSTRRTVDGWCDVLSAALDALLGGRDVVAPRLSFDASMRRLRESAVGCDFLLDADAFRALLESRFAEPAEAQNDGAGAVTLAALATGRVLPARVVCLLGMDDGVFPRPRRAAGFDRIALASRAGDHDPSAEDRQCFLDAVLAARDCLVVTYAGRTAETNERVAPAVPVAELLDVVDATFAVPDDAGGKPVAARTLVTREHPLQPFSPRNFGLDAFSHDPVQLAGARALQGARRSSPPFLVQALGREEPRVVTLDALAAYFNNPCRTFLVEHLQVRRRVEDEMEVREPASLDKLDEYTLRDVLLREALGGTLSMGTPGDDPSFARARADGSLPHGALGWLAFEKARDEATQIAANANEYLSAAITEPLAVDCVVGGWKIVGQFKRRRADGGVLEIQTGKLRAKRLGHLWARHVALHLALGRGVTSTLIVLPDEDECPRGICEFAPLADAEREMRVLLDVYDRGTRAPLPHFPETSSVYASTYRNAPSPGTGEAHHTALDAARKKFAPGTNGTRKFSDGEEEEVRRLFGETMAALDDPAFAATALAVWGPVHAHLTVFE